MMYDFGTGVEELAYAAQNFGYKGTIPFHNWDLSDLQAELSEGRTPVVAIGSNGAGQPGHFVTVTGISPDGKWVSYNDPTLGEQTITAEEFNRLWGLQGNSGVAVRKTVLASEKDLVPSVAVAAALMAIISQTPLALRRMGIGGRLISGAGSISRKRIRPKRSSPTASLGGVPSRTAKAISRIKKLAARPKQTQTNPPPRDPSPQMSNDAPPLSPQRWKTQLINSASTSTPIPVIQGTPEPPDGSANDMELKPSAVPVPTPEWVQVPDITISRSPHSSRVSIRTYRGVQSLLKQLPHLKSGSETFRRPLVTQILPYGVLSVGRVDSLSMSTNQNPNMWIYPGGGGIGARAGSPQVVIASSGDSWKAGFRIPLNQFEVEMPASSGVERSYSITNARSSYVTFKKNGFWNSTVTIDTNHIDMTTTADGMRVHGQSGIYVEFKPGPVILSAVVVGALLLTPWPDDLAIPIILKGIADLFGNAAP